MKWGMASLGLENDDGHTDSQIPHDWPLSVATPHHSFNNKFQTQTLEIHIILRFILERKMTKEKNNIQNVEIQ
jgi:hypothetical protein